MPFKLRQTVTNLFFQIENINLELGGVVGSMRKRVTQNGVKSYAKSAYKEWNGFMTIQFCNSVSLLFIHSFSCFSIILLSVLLSSSNPL